MPSIRHEHGVCLQQDVLFLELTVHDHLRMFAVLKGVADADLRQAVDQAIAEVGLTQKTHTPAKALSGGMKRKLCLAIAFIGDSSLLLIDEPTVSEGGGRHLNANSELKFSLFAVAA